MEAADVLRYLGVFLSGGVSGGVITAKLLDHWLADRKDRRTGLRPKDQERIQTVRLLAEKLWLWTIDGAYDGARRVEPDWTDVWQKYLFAMRAVDELDDRRLRKAWKSFSSYIVRLRGATRAGDDDDGPSGDPPDWTLEMKALETARGQLVRELNRLERRR